MIRCVMKKHDVHTRENKPSCFTCKLLNSVFYSPVSCWCPLAAQTLITGKHKHPTLLPINSNLSESFSKSDLKSQEKKRERCCISATSPACEDQSTPMGGRRTASDSPQCSAAKWNNANQALITSSLACGFQLAAITLSGNSWTKSQTIAH